MVMGDVLFGHYSVAQYGEFCLRLVLAFIAGGVIGYERSNHFKEAAQAVSGISFLCAGVIIKVGGNIKGLTTAAGIWMTASLGLAIGAGMYIVSGVSLALILILQYAVTKVRIGSDAYDSYRLKFVVRNDDDFETVLKNQLDKWGVQVTESSINWKRGDTAEFDIVVRRAERISFKDIKSFAVDHPAVVSFYYNPMHMHLQY